MVREIELFNCRWRVRFQGSMVGNRLGSSRILTLSPLGIGMRPLEGMDGKTKGAGPTARLKAAVFGPLLVRFWLARTGRFWVTTWPKMEPNTPISKLRPYPARMTVLGLGW